MFKLKKYLKPFIIGLLLAIILLFVQAIAELNLPNYMSDIINVGIQQNGVEDRQEWIALKQQGVDLTNTQMTYLLKIGGIMLGVALISGIATVFVSLISSRIAAGVAKKLRNDIFEKVEKFSHEEYNKFSTASLITRSTNDVMQIQQLLTMGIRMIFYAPIMAIGGILMAVDKSISMSWIIALACVLVFGVIIVMFAIVLPKFKVIQTFIDKLNLVARENLNGISVIKAFGTRNFELKRFDKANRDLANTNLFVNRVMTFMMPAMMLIMNFISILTIWVGAHYIETATIQVGDMMAFMQYSMQIIMSFLMISMMFVFIPRAAVSAARIAEVLETEPSIYDPKNPKKSKKEKMGIVEFKDVSFRYGDADEDALENITFTAKPGETVAFIGPTGSGKTTLVNLIPRFYDVTKGEVRVNGVNVKDLTQKELHANIGYVPQKSILTSGTIESNIKYGNEELSEKEIEEITNVAQSTEFISEKTEGLQSEIAQGGTNVSGGQRQRLSIARALAIKPSIYIFDDSFSALDFKTDANLRKDLKKYAAESTMIVVAQRVSTIMDADQIYVIDNGKIIAHGTHRELLKNCPEYYEIASSQLTKEDLEHE